MYVESDSVLKPLPIERPINTFRHLSLAAASIDLHSAFRFKRGFQYLIHVEFPVINACENAYLYQDDVRLQPTATHDFGMTFHFISTHRAWLKLIVNCPPMLHFLVVVETKNLLREIEGFAGFVHP